MADKRCATCRMFWQGACWGYDRVPVSEGWVCDSWEQGSTRTLDAPAEPTVKWFERLLSQDRLREAFDGCRDHIEASCGPAVLTEARQLANLARNGQLPDSPQPSQQLVDALTEHFTGLYALGHDTVRVELAKQRRALGRQLDGPGDTAAVGATRLARARARGQHSARNIVSRIRERLGRDQITGLRTPVALQTGAEAAATAQLRVEALTNTAVSINDGRYDGAMSAGDVVGGVYTSVMDERSCDPCIAADTGDVLPPEEAVLLGPPNPDCNGGDFCRCAIVWTLSTDPAALSAVT